MTLCLGCARIFLGQRARQSERPEHAVNARLVSPGDAPDLVRSMELLIARRPSSILIDSSRTAARATEIISRRLNLTKDAE
jgi:hypothetical protein